MYLCISQFQFLLIVTIMIHTTKKFISLNEKSVDTEKVDDLLYVSWV